MKTKKNEKRKEKPKYSVLNNAAYLLKDIYKCSKILFALLFVEMICSIISPMFWIYLPKIAVDLVSGRADVQKIIITLGIFALAMVAINITQNFCSCTKYVYKNNMRFECYFKKILEKSLNCDYVNLESAEGQIRRQKAMNCFQMGDGSGSTVMIEMMIGIVSSAICFGLYSSLISLLNPLIILFLAILTLANFGASEMARKYDEKHRDKSSEFDRKLWYIESDAQDVSAGKDVRVYGMKHWFVSLRDRIFADYRALKRDINNRYFASAIAHLVVLLIRDGVSYGYLIWLVSNGNISIGEFVLYFGAITGFSGFIGSIAESVSKINSASVSMGHARDFLEYSDSPEPKNPVDPPDLTSTVSISFKNVDFSYSAESGKILDGFDMEIKSGAKVALVGVNGVGKTTIVKLLCGFYYPDSGEISINGINIKNFRKKDLFKLISAVFQDIAIFPFTVAENISMQTQEETDFDRVWQCLEKAGLSEDLKKYENGIKSPMTKQFDENGVVLSGGQQQKLLMARALYKDAPILILDEPTAALDPIAESETYEKFHELSKDKTAVYISHRLASTRVCDCIAFLKNGRIAESGTHDELMQKNGEYANMFEIQSHYYKKENMEMEEATNG